MDHAAEGRLPTKLRQKLERRSEAYEVTSSAGNVNSYHMPVGSITPSGMGSNDSASGFVNNGGLNVVRVGIEGSLHGRAILSGAPASSFQDLRALVPIHPHGIAAHLLCVQNLPPQPPQVASNFSKPDRASVDELMATQSASSSQNRVERRLAQNREAARKCRQKKKAYLHKLEEEIQALRHTSSGKGTPLSSNGKDVSLASMQATSARSGSSSDTGAPEDRLLQLRGFQDQAVSDGLRLRDTLACGASEEALRPVVEDVVERLRQLHRYKEKALRTASMLALMAGDHLHAPQRVLLWLGGDRPTESLRLALEELHAANMPPGRQERLQRILEDCFQQEEALSRAYMVLKSDILTHLSGRHLRMGPSSFAFGSIPAQAPGTPLAAADGEATLSPQLLGKLSAMRVLLAEAEDLRMSVLAEMQQLLPLPQFALVLARPLELLHTLNSTADALQQLQSVGSLCL